MKPRSNLLATFSQNVFVMGPDHQPEKMDTLSDARASLLNSTSFKHHAAPTSKKNRTVSTLLLAEHHCPSH